MACIPLDNKCDGVANCDGGEDEHDCPDGMSTRLKEYTSKIHRGMN